VANELALREEGALMANEDILSPVMNLAVARKRLQEFQEFVKEYLKEGEDFGTIPGTPKPTLYKPGADKLCELYGLADSYEIIDKIVDFNAHPPLFDYEVRCTLIRMRSQSVVSTGLGSCSSYESRYRWRQGTRKCPKCGSEAIIKGKEEYGGGFLCYAKKGGCGAKFPDNDKSITEQSVGRVENEDLVDVKNTILKMAKKRAKVDATLSATRSSGVFTQDIEDMDVGDRSATTSPEPKTAPQPVQHRTPARQPAKAAAKVEDVMCSQCGGINSHTDDCPTKQPKQSPKQAEGQVIEPEKSDNKFRANFYVEKITDSVTGSKAKYQTLTGIIRGRTDKIRIQIFHASLRENTALLKDNWVDIEVTAKPKTSNPSETMYALENIFGCEDENGYTPWKDGKPAPEDVTQHGVPVGEVFGDTP
jgi:hypothetical protein